MDRLNNMPVEEIQAKGILLLSDKEQARGNTDMYNGIVFVNRCTVTQTALCIVNGDSKHLRNVGKYVPDYILQHPRRQPSSYSS
jgi:hypothetical protein